MAFSKDQTTEPSKGSAAGALLGVCLMVLMATLDMSIVNVSLPSLVAELDTTFAAIQWVILSYVLALTCLMLTVSRLGDMFGKKRTFALGLVIFTVSSGLCGLAPSVGWLIAFRCLQGVGAAMSQALGMAIVTETAPPDRRGRAIGVIGATVSVGLSAGPSVGGLLIGLFGWRSIFFINVPLGVLAWIIFQRSTPELSPADKGARFDAAGAVTLFIALCCYCLAMTWGQDHGFGHARTLWLLAAAAVGATMFVAIEKRHPYPMLDLYLFKNIPFTLNLLMSALAFVGMSAMFVVPFYLQYALGFSPAVVGVLMVTVPLAMGVISPWAGSLADRRDPRAITLLGLCLTLAGCLAMTTITAESGWFGYVWRIIPVGLGLGFFQAPNNLAIMSNAPKERMGVASGLLNYTRVFGQTTGLPVMGSIFSLLVLGTGAASSQDMTVADPVLLAMGLQMVYGTAAVITVVNIGLGTAAWWKERKRPKTAASSQ